MIDRCGGAKLHLHAACRLGEIYALWTAEDRTRHYWLCERERGKGNTLRLDRTGEVLVVSRLAPKPSDKPSGRS